MKTKEKHKISMMEIVGFLLSCFAIIISVTTFVLPLTNSKLVIDDPSNIFFRNNTNENYDEIIIPLIFNNYGSFVRSVYKIESTISVDNMLIPIRPYFEYESINNSTEELTKILFSTFIVQPNDGIKVNVGFKYDSVGFTRTDQVPNVFHFEPNKLYSVSMRFYTTQNSFFGKKTEIIQVIYAFETKNELADGEILNVSKQTFFKLNDTHIIN